MSSPVAPTDIAVLALDIINTAEISDIEMPGDDDIAAVMNRWWDVTRQSCLEELPWNFATKRVAIPLSATSPAFGFTDQYQLPNDYLHNGLVYIKDDTYPLTYWDYAIESGFLLIDNSSATTLNIAYIYDIEDVTKMSASFKIYIATQLAYFTVRKLTGNGPLTKTIQAMVSPARLQAKAINGQESPPRAYRKSAMLTGRQLYQG